MVRNITIKLGYANAKVFKCTNEKCHRPGCYTSRGSHTADSTPCAECGSPLKLLRHVSFVDCPGTLSTSCVRFEQSLTANVHFDLMLSSFPHAFLTLLLLHVSHAFIVMRFSCIYCNIFLIVEHLSCDMRFLQNVFFFLASSHNVGSLQYFLLIYHFETICKRNTQVTIFSWQPCLTVQQSWMQHYC